MPVRRRRRRCQTLIYSPQRKEEKDTQNPKIQARSDPIEIPMRTSSNKLDPSLTPKDKIEFAKRLYPKVSKMYGRTSAGLITTFLINRFPCKVLLAFLKKEEELKAKGLLALRRLSLSKMFANAKEERKGDDISSKEFITKIFKEEFPFGTYYIIYEDLSMSSEKEKESVNSEEVEKDYFMEVTRAATSSVSLETLGPLLVVPSEGKKESIEPIEKTTSSTQMEEAEIIFFENDEKEKEKEKEKEGNDPPKIMKEVSPALSLSLRVEEDSTYTGAVFAESNSGDSDKPDSDNPSNRPIDGAIQQSLSTPAIETNNTSEDISEDGAWSCTRALLLTLRAMLHLAACARF